MDARRAEHRVQLWTPQTRVHECYVLSHNARRLCKKIIPLHCIPNTKATWIEVEV